MRLFPSVTGMPHSHHGGAPLKFVSQLLYSSPSGAATPYDKIRTGMATAMPKGAPGHGITICALLPCSMLCTDQKKQTLHEAVSTSLHQQPCGILLYTEGIPRPQADSGGHRRLLTAKQPGRHHRPASLGIALCWCCYCCCTARSCDDKHTPAKTSNKKEAHTVSECHAAHSQQSRQVYCHMHS